ncbi:hypothetical protein J6590_028827 [Homalodisca vitripennis]|nr:hypothetical protein J6590_028827 [Homalodisca vitripennis]
MTCLSAQQIGISNLINRKGFLLKDQEMVVSLVNFGKYKGVCKKGKSINFMSKVFVSSNVKVKPEKLNDVDNLLKKHFSEDWQNEPSLLYYKQVLTSADHVVNNNNGNDEDWCEPREFIEEATV